MLDDCEILLEGVVGSQAHGLATEASDADLLGVFAYRTERVLGLDQPEQSFVTHAPDRQRHEIGKVLQLGLKCNPAILELLWLPWYSAVSTAGGRLVGIRRAFLSRDLVRGAYLEYAKQQWKKVQSSGFVTISDDPSGRTLKHARHAFRMLESGMGLYTTGNLQVEVADRSWYLDVLPTLTVEQAAHETAERIRKFTYAHSPLPERPNRDVVEQYLISVRKALI